ncbi:MAG: LecA/PA-IL family lectin [Pyrinomonadaceae bacterium]
MLLKSKFIRIVCSLCLVFSLAALVAADTIRLKDGSIIKGKIVNFSGGQFTVVFGDGSRQRKMNFYADEIESIEFDGTSMPVSVVKTTTQLPIKSNPQINNNPVTNSPKTDTNNPVIIPPTTNTSTTTNPPYTNKTPTELPKPVQLSVKVLADNTANGWTNTGWVVKKGQKIKVSGKGSVSLGNGNYSTANGLSSIADKEKLMQDKPTGALIAVIGDDNNAFIFVGESTEFVAARDGSLFLGINEGNLDDNSGAFEVSIEIMPN